MIFPWSPFKWGREISLRRIVIYLLSQKAMTGAEIIDNIEAMTLGWWKPSPGSIYPLLKNLSEEGLVNRDEKNRYFLTDKGKKALKEFFPFVSRFRGPSTLEEILDELDNYISYLEDIKFKIKPYKEKIKNLKEKLEKLLEE